jgi:hypothetical protein
MRILTRPDFDGIVSAVLLGDALNISAPVIWAEPNAMQHGEVDVQEGDVIANLGYHERCFLWFDHHESNRIDIPFKGVFRISPSASRVVFDYFKEKGIRFKRDYTRLIEETDRIDSAHLSLDEVIDPWKYPYISLSMTVLSHNYEDEPYWNKLVNLLSNNEIEDILEEPEVKKRVTVAIETNNNYMSILKKYTADYGNVTVTDFRPLNRTPNGNRFLVFYLYPGSVVNIRVRFDNRNKENIRISVGHSIFNRDCRVNAGALCARFGGGGHKGAGACTVPAKKVDHTLAVIIDILGKNQPLHEAAEN